MSGSNPVDPYDAVIADMELQIMNLQSTIASLRAMQASRNGVPSATFQNVPKGTETSFSPSDIAVDAFHALTVAQSIRKFLGMRNRKPATTQDIVEALTAGGHSGADGANFSVVVNNSLNRMSAADGDVSKVKRGLWGLKEWYAST
jgi:hypothetical protein